VAHYGVVDTAAPGIIADVADNDGSVWRLGLRPQMMMLVVVVDGAPVACYRVVHASGRLLGDHSSWDPAVRALALLVLTVVAGNHFIRVFRLLRLVQLLTRASVARNDGFVERLRPRTLVLLRLVVGGTSVACHGVVDSSSTTRSRVVDGRHAASESVANLTSNPGAV
jgi:hypothetical protein